MPAYFFAMRINKKQKQGQTALLIVFFMLVISLSAVFGVAGIALKERSAIVHGSNSVDAYFAAEAGVEDAVYRLKRNKQLGSIISMSLDGAYATTTVTTIGNQRQIETDGTYDGDTRSVRAIVSADPGASFAFALQAGSGGLSMGNGASIDGNVYSNGSINGGNNAYITGWVRVAGQNQIKDMEVYGDAYAYTLDDVKTRGNAYYQVIDPYSLNWLNNYDGGTAYPGSGAQPAQPFSVTDEQILNWKNIASTTRVTDCTSPYRPAANEIMWGLYNCNVAISNSTVYFKHPVWVKGDINIGQSVSWHLDPSAGATSGVVIASGDAASSTSIGTISTGNHFHACGSLGYNATTKKCNTSNGSFAVFVATYSGTSGNALSVGQGPVGGVFYAPYGRFHSGNQIDVSAVAAKELVLTQSASIKYETGLALLGFPATNGGAWSIGSWGEVLP